MFAGVSVFGLVAGKVQLNSEAREGQQFVGMGFWGAGLREIAVVEENWACVHWLSKLFISLCAV